MTQIIERVARAIYEADYGEAAVKGDYDKYSADCAEGPDINLYRIFAQAALKEIKLDKLVGALKNSTNTIEYLSMDIENLMSAAMTEEMELVKSNRALLSELEKTE